MDEIPVLQYVHPGLVVSVLLMLTWIGRRSLSPISSSPQIRRLWLLIFLLAAFVPFARNTHHALMQTLTMLRYVPIFVSIVLYIDSYRRLRSFLNAWVVLLSYVAIKGILHRGIGGSSFLADENDFALLMNMMFPFGVSLALYAQTFRRKVTWLGSSVVGIASVVVSQSRGGFIGLLAVLTTFWVFGKRRVLSLLVVAALGVTLYLVASPAYWAEMATSTQTDTGTAKERLDSWDAAWEMFKDQPLGVGGGNFPVWFPKYQPQTMTRAMWGRAAHSLWFTLLSELGVFGVWIYLWLLVANLRDIAWLRRFPARDNDDRRYVNHLAVAFLASFAGYFVSGIFLSVLYYPHYYYLTALIVATRRIAGREAGDLQPV